ncbi:hypothetical protein B296_00042395 [Ensete ventricosum]|uniref:Uncharacterized protein n=1 Tax=Ensete ventricosum TaxID=4639 RepID=A0A426ZIQ1_ENSVE|nr:hypothetical protein B296_00042395 [Ensete ventricosum]
MKKTMSGVSIDFLCTLSEIENTGHSRRISPWEVIRAWFHKKLDGYKLCTNRAESCVSIGFSCTIPKLQNIGHPNVLTHCKSYEHGFAKKHDGYKLYAKVKFRSIFRAPSQKFEILANPDIFAHELSFDRFSCTISKIQNMGNYRCISP